MATTRTVFNWPVPEGSDFIKIGWSAIQAMADAIAATIVSIRDRPISVMRQSTTQTGLAAGWQTIALQAEDIDTHNGHDLITNNSRWTCPTGQGGTYAFEGIVSFGTFSSAGLVINSRIRKNGTDSPGSTGNNNSVSATNVNTSSTTGRKIFTLAVGEYVELQGFCSGANWATAIFSDNCSQLIVERIR